MKTGQKVSWNSSGGTARGIIREIVRDGNVSGIPVKITGSKEEPAARIEIIDDEGKPTGTMVGHKLSTLRKNSEEFALHKARYATDIFTTEGEAKARSMDMGLDGVIHVSEYDGQAVYMPAESHEAYLAYYLPEGSEEGSDDYEDEPDDNEMDDDIRLEALRVIIQEVMKEEFSKANTTVSETTKSEQTIKILKIDEEQRIIYGWASVTTYKGELVVDLQGDVIKTETLHKAFNEFMKGVRVGKINHSGEQVGQIVHSFPMSKDICEALEIQSDKEGVISGFHVTDDALWEKVKSGEYAEFSIGGRAQKQEF